MKDRILKNIPAGVRWFDAVITGGNSTPLIFKNNRLHSINHRENSGAGIRLNVNGRTGFSFTNDPDGIEAAVERAQNVTPYSDEENFSLPESTGHSFEPYDERIEKFSVDEEIEKGNEVIEYLGSKFQGISVDLGITSSTGTFSLVNSNGLDASYRDSIYSASVSVTYMPEGGAKVDTYESISSLYPVNFRHLADRIVQKLESASKPAMLLSGRYPLYLPPSAFIRFLGIMLSGLNSIAVWKGVSPLGDKLNEKFFHESFSLHDNPLLPGSPYSFPFDGDGVSGKEKSLIENGMIKNFISDLKYSEKLGMDMSGNASRGFSSMPMPSFSNIIVGEGSEPDRNLVAGIKKGIWAEQFIGLGQSNSVSGDFSANLDLAYLVENGEIAGRLKDCMISGNIYELLKGDFQLSAERETRGSALVPSVLFGGINFSS